MPARLKLRHALALGLVHGPAELLPVSSSAHTTLIPLLARWSYRDVDPQVRKTFEVCLHAGAGAAVALEERHELLAALRSAGARDAMLIATSLLPPALAGLLARSVIARALSRPSSIAAGLCGGSIAMVLADRRPQSRTRADARVADGLALGFAQAAALIPGVSRSGATLAAARARRFTRADSASLSRHAGLAVIFAACVHEAPALLARRGAPRAPFAYTLGAAGALLSTTACLRAQRRLRRAPAPLWPFAFYRLALAALIMRRRAK